MDDIQKAVYQGRLASIKEADSKANLRDELYWPLSSTLFGWEASAIDGWIEDSFWELMDLPQPLAADMKQLMEEAKEAATTYYMEWDD